MTMQRWEPFNELRRMQETMDRMWRGFGSSDRGSQDGMEGWAVPLDVVREGDNIAVHASLPGVKPEDIAVAIDEGVLTIRGHAGRDHVSREGAGAGSEGAEANYLMRERRTGSFYRSLRLPDSLDTDRSQAHYEHGVLSITFPRVGAKKARQLTINVSGNVSGSPSVIEGNEG